MSDAPLDWDGYQAFTRTTACYPQAMTGQERGVFYCGLKLAGEAGETAEKLGKALRGSTEALDFRSSHPEMVGLRESLTKELGDVLWYVARLADELELPLSVVMQTNVAKLQGRQKRGTLHGDGDDR